MKLLFFPGALIGWLLFAASAAAQAPASLAGRIFYQSGTTATVGLRAYGASGHVLHADGRYTQLYNLGWDITREIGGWQAPSDGSYEYTRTGANTGVLTLHPPGFGRSEMRLVFVSDQHGTIEPPPLVIRNFSFWLGSPGATAPLANVALRAHVRSGGTAIAGFVISGAHQRAVLIRGVGPGLAGFGVTGFLPDPRIAVPRLTRPIDANDQWHSGNAGESIRRVETLVGAFPLEADSRDAAVIVPALSPGAYTVVADSADAGADGEVLIEVYLLP